MPISTEHYNYLIIGGTTKAATTSLYYYLADHPNACISSLKETRFFMDEDYPVPPLGAHWSDGYEKYQDFFHNKSQDITLRVEASPDYLYSNGTAQRIKENLPDAKIVFILRNPASRMISWFKYAKQRADIPQEMEFDEYVEQQMNNNYFEQAKQERRNGVKPVSQAYFFSALEHGCYSKYLRPYFDVLGKENIKILFYKDVCSNPQQILKEVSEFAGISPDFYENYEFKVFNRSDTMRNPQLHGAYDKLRSDIRKRTHNLPIHKLLKQFKKLTDPLYFRLNTSAPAEIVIPKKTVTLLEEFYSSEISELESLLGYNTPWQVKSSTT